MLCQGSSRSMSRVKSAFRKEGIRPRAYRASCPCSQVPLRRRSSSSDSHPPPGRIGADDQTPSTVTAGPPQEEVHLEMVFTIAFLAAQTPPGGLPSSEEHLELPLGVTTDENLGAERGSPAWLSGATPPHWRAVHGTASSHARGGAFLLTPQARQDRTGTRRLSSRHGDGMVSVVKKR